MRLPQITRIFRAVPPHQEGRIAIVTNVGAGCGGREDVERGVQFARARACDTHADGEIVWS